MTRKKDAIEQAEKITFGELTFLFLGGSARELSSTENRKRNKVLQILRTARGLREELDRLQEKHVQLSDDVGYDNSTRQFQCVISGRLSPHLYGK